jgi:1,4-alpha-glucan branching enzyme
VRFTRELIKLRWRYPGLRGQGFRLVHVHDHVYDHVYENWVNADTVGNGGRVHAEPQRLHDFSHSAALTLPANSLLVFAR